MQSEYRWDRQYNFFTSIHTTYTNQFFSLLKKAFELLPDEDPGSINQVKHQ